jgi:hypothetical protein
LYKTEEIFPLWDTVKNRILNHSDFTSNQSAPASVPVIHTQHDSEDPQAEGGLKINQAIIIFINGNSLASQLAVQLIMSHEFPF